MSVLRISKLLPYFRDYAACGDNMSREDAKYTDLVTKLHTPVLQQAPVQLRCGSRCANPYNSAIQVRLILLTCPSVPVGSSRTQLIEFGVRSFKGFTPLNLKFALFLFEQGKVML